MTSVIEPDRWERARRSYYALYAGMERALNFPFLRLRFRRAVGYWPHLHAPRSHNEKVQWRKLYDRNPLFPVLSDKYRLRDYVHGVLGPEAEGLFARLYHVTDDPDDIPFADLPGDLAIKANHGCGWNLFLRAGAPVDHQAVRARCRAWLGRRYGMRNHEWAYRDIPPRIVVEELLLDPAGDLPKDVKLHVFDGRVHLCQTEADHGRHPALGYFDRNWTARPMLRTDVRSLADMPRPPQFDAMIRIAETLGAPFDYLRVDFLLCGNRHVLNEITLYRTSGLKRFNPESYDWELGALWHNPAWGG